MQKTKTNKPSILITQKSNGIEKKKNKQRNKWNFKYCHNNIQFSILLLTFKASDLLGSHLYLSSEEHSISFYSSKWM